MSIQTNIIKNGAYRFTTDGIFAIKIMQPSSSKNMCDVEDSNYLFIQTDKVNDILSQSSALSNLIKNNFIILDETEPTVILGMQPFGRGPKNTYNKYIFHRKLIDKREMDESGEVIDDNGFNENDCLKFGECMAVANKTGDINRFNTMIGLNESPPVLQVNKRKFGEDEDLNFEIPSFVKDSEKNNFAVPKNGECYAMVRSGPVPLESDYHIAFVLITYENINITIEASNGAAREYYPRFGFYDINPNGCTFYKVFSRYYTNGETIVLKIRNLNTVLKEIDKEIDKNNMNNMNINNSKKRKFGSGKKKRIVYIKKKMTKRKLKVTNKNKNKNKKSVKNH